MACLTDRCSRALNPHAKSHLLPYCHRFPTFCLHPVGGPNSCLENLHRKVPVMVLTCGCRKKELKRPGLRRPAIWHGQTYRDVEGGKVSGNGGLKDGDMVVLGGAGALVLSNTVLASLDDDGGGGGDAGVICGGGGDGNTGAATCGGGSSCGGGGGGG